MALPQTTHQKISVLLLIGVLAWIVELLGLIFVERSCNHHSIAGWASGAQLPSNPKCSKTFRYIWWSVLFELPLVIGLASSVLGKAAGGYEALGRFRLSWLSILTIATVLQIWGANVALNLTDSVPGLFTSHTQQTRSWVMFIGFAVLSAVNLILIFVLGEDINAHTTANSEPLLADSV